MYKKFNDILLGSRSFYRLKDQRKQMDIIMWTALHSASLEGINEVNHEEWYKTSSCTYWQSSYLYHLYYVFNAFLYSEFEHGIRELIKACCFGVALFDS